MCPQYAGIAQLVEPWIVIPVVAGSSPVSRPTTLKVFGPYPYFIFKLLQPFRTLLRTVDRSFLWLQFEK